jgi:anti-sigma B factor antagonist
MQLEITRTSGDARDVVLHLSGELDISTETELAGALRGVIDAQDRPDANDRPDIVVDLAELSFIDSSGVRALLEGNERATRRGTRLRARNARGIVARVLYLTGVDALLGVDSPPSRGNGSRG